MSKQREFLKLSDKAKIRLLLNCLTLAMTEHPEICNSSYSSKHKTDVLGIAKQYGASYGIKRDDFDMITNLKVGDLIDMFNIGFTKNK